MHAGHWIRAASGDFPCRGDETLREGEALAFAPSLAARLPSPAIALARSAEM